MTAKDSRAKAFTRIELILVVVLIAILTFVLIIPYFARAHQVSMPIRCINNIKEIGIAYRVWSNDNGDKYPYEVPQESGGWRNLLLSTKAGEYAWTNYAVMATELGQSTKILVCPQDKRQPATTFSNLSNINVSFFVGVGPNDPFLQGLLGGDRNLSPGDTPHNDYGFSPSDGKGNDVTIKSSVCWSLKMHSEGNSDGAGNILLGDGSAQQLTSRNLNLNWMKPWMISTNAQSRGTNVVGVRLIFP